MNDFSKKEIRRWAGSGIPEPSNPIHLLYSSGPDDFALKTGSDILKKIESVFHITIPREKKLYGVFTKDEDWIRFRRVFFQDNI